MCLLIKVQIHLEGITSNNIINNTWLWSDGHEIFHVYINNLRTYYTILAHAVHLIVDGETDIDKSIQAFALKK